MTAPSVVAEARMRYKRCQDISDMARFMGLDVTPYKVNRNLSLWERWSQGLIRVDLIMRITGVSKIEGR